MVKIDISLGRWKFLRIAPDEDGVEHLYIVHTEEGGFKEINSIDLGPNTRSTFEILIMCAQRLKIHAVGE
ncbi:hypothetical protein EVC27_022 [Rhizobium phage RHph_I1_6]|uniref:Uncharacterized protein n=1 Tax=Rhizobium phage RHph_I1_6 TaxID=2509728 RepID=A0A7S5RFH8_9CAUD|nr:hypothetical protein PP745_gp022 [Rhizobium phage RHph_I1_6]QIG76547.1 hypothetical protein EVC27_022 [Rhizobium phage RHph_I1_6]